MMFNGIAAFVLYFSVKNSDPYVKKLQTVSQVLLYPALFTLTAGIFVGAVWANVSWGRYWGWDPKEVWALVTMLVYSFAMHVQSLPAFRRPLFFHAFSILAFLTVFMTYFGVNLLFSGMHSY
jgi:ABC-type transport system involved in cytochrome c biogenesis permease subunit